MTASTSRASTGAMRAAPMPRPYPTGSGPNPSRADRAARAPAQCVDVVVGCTRLLSGICHESEVTRRGQAALVAVEDVQPREVLAGQCLYPHPDLAVETAVGALPLVERG